MGRHVRHGEPIRPFRIPVGADDSDVYRSDIEFDPARAKPLDVPAGQWHEAHLEIGHVERSLDLVRYAIELGGFAGVKIYPPAGFLPLGNPARFGEEKGQRLDAALRSLYAYCVASEVPILTHAAHSNGFEDGFDDLASPAGWEAALAEYPDLRICFGHFGHLHGEPTDQPGSGATSFGWPSRFVDMIDRFPNVYADVGNSRFAISEDYRRRFVAMIREFVGPDGSGDPRFEKRRKRLMFGTDYWMNTLNADHRGYLDIFDTTMSDVFDADFHGQFMGDNAIRFLGFAKGPAATRNRARIQAFYGPNQLPNWLN